MTVIKDPGNVTGYSYSDGQVRNWKDTSHLWEVDAMDPNSTATYSWSLASQLWRVTAQTWKSRADTAYDGGSWGSGTTWQAHANTAYDSGTWGVGTTWQAHANTAYDSGTWGTGNTWQTDYNNALAPASVDHKSASVAIPAGADGIGGNLTSITADRTGQWVVVGRADPHNTQAGVALYNGAGTLLAGGGYFFHLDLSGALVGSPQAGCVWQGSLNNGDVVYVRAAEGSAGSGNAYIDAYFIPTQANPH